MKELQRLTTEYIEIEDRIRITGEVSAADTVVMWLNQRLLLRLLPHLFLWLEKQSESPLPSEIAQSFAQEAAKANLTAETPVERRSSSTETLVVAVDLSPSAESMRLGFRAEDKVVASLSLNPIALRQWLSILQTLWTSAEWPREPWPTWIVDQQQASADINKTKLH